MRRLDHGQAVQRLMTAREAFPSAVRFPATNAGRAQLAVALLVIYVCLFNGLNAFGLVGPDEPRYASIARDMAADGDWITPRLHGEPWLEKPILYYWVAAVGYQLFGDGETAARFPSVTGAVATLLALGWLAFRFHGPNTAALFVLAFPSSIAVLVFARAATTDMLFTSTLALAMAAATPLLVIEQPRRKFMCQMAFGTALGLSVLAKGPVGVLLAAGGSVMGALLSAQFPRIWRLASPWSLASFGVVAIPWYLLCAAENPEFLEFFLVSHNVERFLTPVFRHQQPFWFFGPVLLLGLAPWTATIVATLHDVTTRSSGRNWRGSPSMFLAGWVLFPVIFFSLSQSKLPGYVLPSVPAAVVLLAHVLASGIGNQTRARVLGLGAAASMGAIAVTFLIAPGVDSAGVEPGAVRPLALLLGTAALAASYLGYRRQLRATVTVSALGIALALWQLNTALMPRLDPLISSRVVAREATALAAGHQLRSFDLHRTWHYGLEYYLQRPVAEWTTDVPQGTVVVTNLRGMRSMQLEGASVLLLQDVSAEALIVRIDPEGERLTHR